ncbi:hypothetical protein [Agarivorans sp. 1_MG-2023]|uniref:hypothetical protein n=1 Tax=Agarivorans sp. 1_MG-2023 TaxID=3062634 RepID=UPI0026E2B2FD|nr:hypothetical protein [Agarivorans sp. 1_MG-2023]MDO6764805.1 hypothetical protein [Agarivorans sp. 1_MG-2023]
MEKVRRSVYLFDFGNHYKQIIHSKELYKTFGEVKVICTKNQKNNYKEFLEADCLDVISFSTLFFLFVKAVSSSRFVLLTGPFYTKSLVRFLSSVSIFFVLLARRCLFKWSVVYVKDINSYTNGSVLDRLSLSLANNIFFESEALSKIACSLGVGTKEKNKASYVYFDQVDSSHKQANYKVDMSPIMDAKKNGCLIVGVIGQFDTQKRDYQLLLQSKSEKIFFVQVGRYVTSESNAKAVNELKGFLNFLQNDFSNRDLDYVLSHCDVLLSLNSDSAGYDSCKGTAAFGEAISVRKPLVIPSFCDKDMEFKSFCFYYTDSQSFSNAIAKSKLFRGTVAFDYFNVERVRQRLLH